MRLELNYAIDQADLATMQERAEEAFDTLTEKTGPGNDFLGWLDQPVDYDKEEYERIKVCAERIRQQADVLVVVGIGGSYLGARAVIEMLRPSYGQEDLEVLFAGNHLSAQETVELLDYIEDKEVAVNVISKSGTTTEPAIAFRILQEKIIQRYGEEGAKERIYVTTDTEKGALRPLAEEKGYESFVVPDDIGGRFTVLTAVGLLPIAAAGIDIDALMAGAQEGRDNAMDKDFSKNLAMQYAATRNYLYDNGKDIEILVAYEPKLLYVQEWWKQLYGESENKDGKGIFPVSVLNTTDLHSLGQAIQDGQRNLFETVIWVDQAKEDIEMTETEEDLDGLNYLAGKTLHEVNKNAMLGTLQAHVEGEVPNILIEIERMDEKSLGELLYFFEFAVGISGYMLEVNPFNQPGVEMYKSSMFRLLGKPGY